MRGVAALIVMRRPPLAEPHDAAIVDDDGALAARGEARIVGDEHERRAHAPVQPENQVDDLLAGLAVEIAGRLIGEQDLGLRRKRPRKRDPLLLAARKLAGHMMMPPESPTLASASAARSNASLGPGIRAAEPHSRSRSWLGSDGRTGTRCRWNGRVFPQAGPRLAL